MKNRLRKSNKILMDLSTVQKAVQDVHQREVCAITTDSVHLLDGMFKELFKDKEVTREDFNSVDDPYKYIGYSFGTKFFCISANPYLLPRADYPVETLALDLLDDWGLMSNPYAHQFRVVLEDGSYRLRHQKFKDNEERETVFSYGQALDDESDLTLEQAILDHMEGVHNNGKN